jgi:hypothetical protein
MIVEIIKASLGWGILFLGGLFGYAIIKGEVTEANSFGLLAMTEPIVILTTAYCLWLYSAKGGKENEHQ